MDNCSSTLLAINKHGFDYQNKNGFKLIDEIQNRILLDYIELQKGQKVFSKKLILSRDDFNP